MKKFIILSIFMSMVFTPVVAFAEDIEGVKYPDAPRWEDYVPEKYQNPRTDFKRGNAIAELTAGIILTDLLITAPVGVPMICHSATKLKNISYAKKKVKFFDGLSTAETIENPAERRAFYRDLINDCHLKKRK